MSDEKSLIVADKTDQRSMIVTTQEERTAAIISRARDMLTEIETGMAVQARLAEVALLSTTDADWDDIGPRRSKDGTTTPGTPRLNSRGAFKIRRICQLNIETFGSKLVEAERDENGNLIYFAYECMGRVTSPWGPSMDCVGRADSDVKLHSIRYEYINGRREQVKLPASEINRVFIAQQAQTLCIVRGVTQYLGLQRLTWDEVTKYTSAKQARTAFLTMPDTEHKTDPKPAQPQHPKQQERKQRAQQKSQQHSSKDVNNNIIERLQKYNIMRSYAYEKRICLDESEWSQLIEKILGKDKAPVGNENKEDTVARLTIDDLTAIGNTIKQMLNEVANEQK